jgi:hypothetical protein
VSAPADLLTGLLALVREAAQDGAAAALAAHVAASSSTARPRLTLEELAHLEGGSRATIRRLVTEGGPVHYLGASPRFDLDEWRAWCAERGRRGTKAAPSKHEVIPGVMLLSRRGGR